MKWTRNQIWKILLIYKSSNIGCWTSSGTSWFLVSASSTKTLPYQIKSFHFSKNLTIDSGIPATSKPTNNIWWGTLIWLLSLRRLKINKMWWSTIYQKTTRKLLQRKWLKWRTIMHCKSFIGSGKDFCFKIIKRLSLRWWVHFLGAVDSHFKCLCL